MIPLPAPSKPCLRPSGLQHPRGLRGLQHLPGGSRLLCPRFRRLLLRRLLLRRPLWRLLRCPLLLRLPLLLLLLLPLLLATPSCSVAKKTQSIWPPEDFYLEVEAGINSGEDVYIRQKLQVWADGVAVYREARPPNLSSNVADAMGLPIYKSLCAYRLAPESSRMLARMLHRARILDLPNVVGEVRGAKGLWIKLAYHGFGRKKFVRVNRRVYGPMNRVLHVINSFMPPGHEFSLPEMVGEPERSHIVDVPPVVESLEGSLSFHKKLIEMFPDDDVLQRDTFALACVQGDIKTAEDCFRRLSEVLANNEAAKRLFPDAGDFDEIKHLEEILAAARRRKALPGGGR